MFRHGQHWSVLMPIFCYKMMSIGNEIKNKVDYIYFRINTVNTARTTPKLASSFFVPEDSAFATLKKKGVFGWAVAVDKFFLSYGL